MSISFLIKNTSNTSSTNFTIKPGTLDGPGGLSQHTDLRLYGYGVHDWGEGVDENLYRMLENFACPQKEDNDYYSPRAAYDYDSTVDPILPKSEHDLGVGNGITNPLPGQFWFNTTDEEMYYYASSNLWKPVNGTRVVFDGSSPPTVTTLTSTGEISSVTRNSLGKYTIAFSHPMTTDYAVTGTGNHTSEPVIFSVLSKSSSSVQVQFYALTTGLYDPSYASIIITQ